MTAEKKAGQTSTPRATTGEGGRRAWVPRTPVEVVLEQIVKQEKKVAELEGELAAEKSMLTKLLQAKKVLEST